MGSVGKARVPTLPIAMADKRSDTTGGQHRPEDGRGLNNPPTVTMSDLNLDNLEQGDKAVDSQKEGAGKQDALTAMGAELAFPRISF